MCICAYGASFEVGCFIPIIPVFLTVWREKNIKMNFTENKMIKRVVHLILYEYFHVNLDKVFKKSTLFLNTFEQAQDFGLRARYTILTNFVYYRHNNVVTQT